MRAADAFVGSFSGRALSCYFVSFLKRYGYGDLTRNENVTASNDRVEVFASPVSFDVHGCARAPLFSFEFQY